MDIININNREDLANYLFNNSSVYSLHGYFITRDGEAILWRTVYHDFDNYANSLDSFEGIVAYTINWEDDDLFCSVTNEQITSAYGD